MGLGNPRHEYRRGISELIKSSPTAKNLGVLMDEKLDVRQQFVLTAWKAKLILVCIKSNVTFRVREVIVSLVRPQL